MKEVRRYICDICKKEHPTKEDAITCEKNHHMPKEVRRDGIFNDVNGYPMGIIVTFDNGNDLFYQYSCGSIKDEE